MSNHLTFEFVTENVSQIHGPLLEGWCHGSCGLFFRNDCGFDWRFGSRCHAIVCLYPTSGARDPEIMCALDWDDHDEEHEIYWQITRGSIAVFVAIIVADGGYNPLFDQTGPSTYVLRHHRQVASEAGRYRAELALWLDFDRDRVDPTWWYRAGMASAGLPSLGKKKR